MRMFYAESLAQYLGCFYLAVDKMVLAAFAGYNANIGDWRTMSGEC
jgi:hypothetical protein